MYAIVEMQGQQFRVEAGKKLFINRMDTEAGATVEFDKVLLVDKDGAVKVGAPYVKGAKVVCEIIDNESRGEKILVFHKKRRKGYRKLNGHRQDLTNLVKFLNPNQLWHIRKVSVVQRTAVNQKANALV